MYINSLHVYTMITSNHDSGTCISIACTFIHQVKHFSDFRLKFDGTVLSDVSCVKNLGMYFDKTISMEQQASAITRSCFQQIRNIGRIRSLISVDACRTLVSSLVISRLDYGNALLYGTNNKNISKLQRVQNTAARLITRKRKYDSITPVLISLHWLPVHYRCQYKLLIYVYKAQQGKAPSYLQELITPYKPNRALRSENSMLLHPPNDVRTKSYGERRFDKARLRSGTVYPCHCGMWLLWTFLKENLKLTFLELLLRISYRFLVVFRILDFFFLTDSALFLKHMILVSFSSFQEYLVFLTDSALF